MQECLDRSGGPTVCAFLKSEVLEFSVFFSCFQSFFPTVSSNVARINAVTNGDYSRWSFACGLCLSLAGLGSARLICGTAEVGPVELLGTDGMLEQEPIPLFTHDGGTQRAWQDPESTRTPYVRCSGYQHLSIYASHDFSCLRCLIVFC